MSSSHVPANVLAYTSSVLLLFPVGSAHSFGLLFQIMRVVSLFGLNRCPSRHVPRLTLPRLATFASPLLASLAAPASPCPTRHAFCSRSLRSRRNSHLHGRLRCRIRRIDVPARQLRIGTSLPMFPPLPSSPCSCEPLPFAASCVAPACIGCPRRAARRMLVTLEAPPRSSSGT